jgi:hypothetical protein
MRKIPCDEEKILLHWSKLSNALLQIDLHLIDEWLRIILCVEEKHYCFVKLITKWGIFCKFVPIKSLFGIYEKNSFWWKNHCHFEEKLEE